VIACNTASQAALAATRKAFPGLLVVGTVPEVKPAAERSRSGVVGVMATAKAVADPYLDALVARHAAGKRVVREAAQDLVAFVERRYAGSSAEERRAAVLPHVERLVAAGADEIVLACTHFLHVAEDIASCASALAASRGEGARVEVVDSRDGVARRLRAVLAEAGLLAPAEAAPSGARSPENILLLSGPPPYEPVYAEFARLYALGGPFPLEADPRGA
jgi:glutamate racemase